MADNTPEQQTAAAADVSSNGHRDEAAAATTAEVAADAPAVETAANDGAASASAAAAAVSVGNANDSTAATTTQHKQGSAFHAPRRILGGRFATIGPSHISSREEGAIALAFNRRQQQPQQQQPTGEESSANPNSTAPAENPDSSESGAPAEQPSFEVGVASDRNRRFRRTMEDSHAVVQNFNGVHGQLLLAVYDGHGGKAVAEYCGQHVANNILDQLKENPTLEMSKAFENAFLTTDAQLKEKGIGNYAGCAAVVAAIVVHEDGSRSLHAANVGDSRALLSRNGEAVRLTYDHKATDQFEVDRINAAGGMVMNGRVNGMLAVTRSLGDLALKEVVVSKPHTCDITLNDKDKVLIVACDGVWDVMSDQDAIDFVLSSEASCQELADAMLRECLQRGSMDNITVIIARL